MPTLFMLLLGSKPPGRHTEQHDVFFGIGEKVGDLVSDLKAFWPEAGQKLHVDAWRAVTQVGEYHVSVTPKKPESGTDDARHLFFINLGGYQRDVFDEAHFKILTVQRDMAGAIQYSKTTEFFNEIHFPGADSHVDDKYGVDVDDFFEVGEVLPDGQKAKWQIVLEKFDSSPDHIHLGYFKLDKLLTS